MSTTECSCKLWPMPGMYAVTSIPVVSRTRATLRRAELGFLGVWVYTRTQTPRLCGEPRNAGALDFDLAALRPRRTNCWMVGKRFSEWRTDSQAAAADWATSDEYTQNPVLRSSAGGRLAAANRPVADR